jgi:hypothetical protein
MKNEYLEKAWSRIMDENKNTFRNYPLTTAHMLVQSLAWMWSVIFSVSIGSYVVFGITAIGHALFITAIGHALFIGAVFMTLVVFQRAEQQKNLSPLRPKS